jgi:hypothetical protein
MRLDLVKIEDRIKKLQEVRRIAGDPEMASILLEFLTTDDQSQAPAPSPSPSPAAVVGDNGAKRSGDDVNQLVKGVLEGTRWDKRV